MGKLESPKGIKDPNSQESIKITVSKNGIDMQGEGKRGTRLVYRVVCISIFLTACLVLIAGCLFIFWADLRPEDLKDVVLHALSRDDPT